MYQYRNYKKISDFYKEDDDINPKCVNYFIRREDDVIKSKDINEQYNYIPRNIPRQVHKHTHNHTHIKPPTHFHVISKPIHKPNNVEHFTQLTWEAKKYENISQPNVWGPAFWFMLHSGSYNYDPSEGIDYMKNFILGLPVMVPCVSCRVHARKYINDRINELDAVCANRDMLFKFFVDFHNVVNKRYNKPEMSLEDAYKLYSGKAEIKTLTFK